MAMDAQFDISNVGMDQFRSHDHDVYSIARSYVKIILTSYFYHENLGTLKQFSICFGSSKSQPQTKTTKTRGIQKRLRNDSQVFEGLAKAMFTPQQLGRRLKGRGLASKSQSPLQKWKENVPNLVVKRMY